jgi:KDO2-lipid IV(A) lauroyltransferase
VYRAPNNPKIDAIIRHARRLSGPHLVPKGAPGARILLKALKSGAHLGLLVDQKMNDGISVPFFGEAAMTASALADLALRFKTPLLAAQPIRLTGARFRLIISPLIEPETGSLKRGSARIRRNGSGFIADGRNLNQTPPFGPPYS